MNKRVLMIGGIGLAVFLILVLVIGQTRKGTQESKGSQQAITVYKNAESLQSKGNLDEAVKLYQRLTEQFPQDEKTADAWYSLGEIYEQEGMLIKANDTYAKIISDFPNFEQISDVEKKVWDLNIKVLFSPIITDSDITYKVEPKDTLGKIARKYNTTVELIKRSNNLENDLIRPGQRLKISTNKFSVIIDKSQNSLALKANDAVFKVYNVATGRYNCTPTGTFSIVEGKKIEHPDWYKVGEGIIPADSEKNVLGTRWMGLSEAGYGIHGGAQPEQLQAQVTDGCIRMLNSDVEELFTILPGGTEATIVD